MIAQRSAASRNENNVIPGIKRGAGYKPNSVPRYRGHDHFTGMLIAQHLLQPTRRSRTGRPQTSPYLVLLWVGFTVPPMSPWERWALTSPFHPYLIWHPARGDTYL